ncbi:F-box protein [Zea mays]|uniref:F-box protein n=2 Tax=Zea mays TaxID=4577 RepID=C0P6Z3_MAIZE|nr:F-box protein At1g47056-like [Zea mays]XP_008663374.1 F-box protein At1g47056-like isoform X1 [Zea mays]ACN28759.1 unknown [Zea mays]ACR35643.1 unknown [Zea mays]AQK44657.1 F-box protein [Zea mays]AQK44658.1 F-box protein [Zea mays]PWZ43447.1 F-box protein [Zea mays]|eukprot:NP_001306670.1 F-box protein At1g47056-like [Zea mays]
MGHSPSSLSKSGPSSPPRRSRSFSPMAPPQQLLLTAPLQVAAGGSGSDSSSSFAPPARDYTQDLPDEILALVFASLSPTDRNACSLICSRWMEVDATTRHRLSLDARAALGNAATALFSRFTAVTKLALRCARDSGSDSLSDHGAAALAAALPSERLARLKLRGLRQLSDAGLASLAAGAPAIRKLSIASCTFGPRAFVAVLQSCPLLEDLSVKRLRSVADTSGAASSIAEEIKFPPALSLRSVCVKDLYNALCFVPLVASSPNLRSLKILRCSGAWDLPLEVIAARAPGLVELHLEKLQVGDRGLAALSACANLEVLFLVKTPECTDSGIISVAEKCHKLRKLHVDGWRTNRIGDFGLMAVARGCPDLQELVLIGVNPTVLSLRMLGEHCRLLERLALCGCETVGDAEIICLAERWAALKKLCIKGCPVSDRGMEALNGGCPSLVKVKLKRCRGVSYECIENLKVTRGESFSISLDVVLEHDAGSTSENGAQENGQTQITELAGQMTGMDLLTNAAGTQSSIHTINRMRSVMSAIRRRFGNPLPP